ncbi:MAG: site-specific integrase, partial [Solobacterium sp.]|nr:site-specific integrase [Solobacterium sp.]
FPRALNTRNKHDTIFAQCFSELKHKPISDITASDIQHTLTERAKTHADDGVKRLHTIWKQIYDTAMLEGYPVVNVSLSVQVPKSRVLPHSKSVIISKADFSNFLSALLSYNSTDGEPTYFSKLVWNILIIMYFCGCRPSEVMALSKHDINFVTMEISISKAVGCNYTDKRVLIPTKTTQSVRQCPIPAELKQHLEKLIAETDNDYLFLDKKGRFLDIDEVSDYINRVSKSCGIKFNAYMLRHLYATDLIKTADARTAQDLLGHASFSMTLDYARSSRDDRAQAVADRKLN